MQGSMPKDHEFGLAVTDLEEQRKDIGRFWLPARQTGALVKTCQPPGDRSKKPGMPMQIRRDQGPSRIEVMREVLLVLEEIAHTIANTIQAVRLSHHCVEQLEGVVRSIQVDMEELLRKLNRTEVG